MVHRHISTEIPFAEREMSAQLYGTGLTFSSGKLWFRLTIAAENSA